MTSTFFNPSIENAKLNPYFAILPCTAQPSGGNNEWWYIESGNGVNCLTYGTGQVFTTKENAIKLAKKWNEK